MRLYPTKQMGQQAQCPEPSHLLQSSFLRTMNADVPCIENCFFSKCFFFLIGIWYADNFILMREILEKALLDQLYHVDQCHSSSFLWLLQASCYFKVISHIQLYLRVKIFITIQRCFSLLIKRGNR